MTIQSQDSVQSQVLRLIPPDYDVFGGLDLADKEHGQE